MFAGYAFAIDYREERGHAYMLSDQRETLRVHQVQQPGACLHCHSSVLPAYRGQGRLAGIGDDRPWEQVMKGFEIVNAMPYQEATELVEHPVSCIDCHAPGSMELRITRPGFMNGIQAFARSDQVLPQFPSIERWRGGPRTTPYDPNILASRQEMRTFICAQCHVEYYFKGDQQYLTYPWHNGLGMDQAEQYYDDLQFHDWYHETTRAPLLKAQHPEFELTSSGIHARSGVACADCHMPYRREGAVKISDHHVRSPLLNIARACQPCHSYPEQEILERAEDIQVRTRALMDRAEIAVVELIEAIGQAMAAGATDAQLHQARQMHRKAHWRVDYVNAENSMGFHAPQESARILGEAIDYARQGQVAVARLGLSRR
jgi:nitrite reductase (cytochrome c-552)